TADTIIPGVQNPHWAAPCCRNEFFSRANHGLNSQSPSTVITSRPSTCPAAIRQEQTGCPSSRTVHAPQSPASQPTLVPVSPRCSRRILDSLSAGGAEIAARRPFTRNEIWFSTFRSKGLLVAISNSPHRSRVLVIPASRQHRIDK